MTTQSDLLARDCASLIHPIHIRNAQETAHVFVKGAGAMLVDADGREFIDAISGLWCVNVGHGRAELAEAAAKQMRELAYCSGYAGSTNPRAIELAERLAGLMYPGINRFYFGSSGAEANEAAIKTACYYWKMHGRPEKTKIVSRDWGYHGTTIGAMSLTGVTGYWPMFGPRLPGVVHIASPYPYRYEAPLGESPGIAAANELEAAILREGPDTVAMFIAEPVQGGTGVMVPPDDYFGRIRNICDEYDVLFCADEVITGFGRTGRWFALEHWDVEPDMIAFAKGVTSGYLPLGGLGVTDRIAETIDTGEQVWMHSYTYSGHPTVCAVALANLDILERESLVPQAAERGDYLLKKLATLSDHPHVGEVRGLGLMAGIELVQDKATKAEFPADEKIGARVHAAAQARGLFTRIRGDVICLAPPFVTTEEQLDRIVEIVGEAIDEVRPAG